MLVRILARAATGATIYLAAASAPAQAQVVVYRPDTAAQDTTPPDTTARVPAPAAAAVRDTVAGQSGAADVGTPPAGGWFERSNLITVARSGGLGLGTFARLVDAAGWGQRLAVDGPFTALAPTDSALAALPDLAAILADSARARQLLEQHLRKGRVPLARLRTILEGIPVRTADIVVANGIIHVIEKPLTSTSASR